MNKVLMVAAILLGAAAASLGLRSTALARGGVYLPKVTHELPSDILGVLGSARDETAGLVQQSRQQAANLQALIQASAKTGFKSRDLDQPARDLASLHKAVQSLAEGIEWLDSALRENSACLQGEQIAAGEKLHMETEALEKEAAELHALAEKGLADYSWLNFLSSGWKIRHEVEKVLADSRRLDKASAHIMPMASAAAGKHGA
jgi:hypothetical protein